MISRAASALAARRAGGRTDQAVSGSIDTLDFSDPGRRGQAVTCSRDKRRRVRGLAVRPVAGNSNWHRLRPSPEMIAKSRLLLTTVLLRLYLQSS